MTKDRQTVEMLKDCLITFFITFGLITAALTVTVVLTSCDNPFLEVTPVVPRPLPPEEPNPEVPRIVGQPQDALYTINATPEALVVSAEVDDDGELSYQWYLAYENLTVGGEAIEDAIEWEYTPPTDELGVFVYYVVVTNTISNGRTAAVASDAARIEVIVRPATTIEIARQPAQMEYIHGDELDLTGMAVALVYAEGDSENIEFAAFADHWITANPAHGEILSRVGNNGKAITVTYGELTVETEPLTVNKAVPVITFPTASELGYGAALRESGLSGGSTSMGDFRWVSGSTIPVVYNAGYDVEFTPYDTENYDYSSLFGWNVDAGKITRRVAITVRPAVISDAKVSVVGPAVAMEPDGWAEGVGSSNYTFSGRTTWSPDHMQFLGDEEYTAIVNLWALENYIFAQEVTGTINGNEAEISEWNGRLVTLTYTFSPTDSRTALGMTVVSPPERALDNYTHDDLLDLSRLTVELSYDDGTTDYVALAQFESRNVGTNYAHEAQLDCRYDDGATLTVSFSIWTIELGKLTVKKLPGAAVSQPVVANITVNSITINAVSLLQASGQPIEYAASTVANENPDNLTWDVGKTYFPYLIDNMTYHVYARSAEDQTHYAGPVRSVAASLQGYTVNIAHIADVAHCRRY